MVRPFNKVTFMEASLPSHSSYRLQKTGQKLPELLQTKSRKHTVMKRQDAKLGLTSKNQVVIVAESFPSGFLQLLCTLQLRQPTQLFPLPLPYPPASLEHK